MTVFQPDAYLCTSYEVTEEEVSIGKYNKVEENVG